MAGRFYGSEGWNPRKIILQILGMQLVFYLAYICGLCILSLFFGIILNFGLIIDTNQVTIHSSTGWAGILAISFAVVVSAIAMAFIVERVKKCADFAFTIYFWHFVICSLFSSVPTRWDWWLIHIVAFAATAFLGEYCCMRREMQEISVDDIIPRRPMDSQGQHHEKTLVQSKLQKESKSYPNLSASSKASASVLSPHKQFDLTDSEDGAATVAIVDEETPLMDHTELNDDHQVQTSTPLRLPNEGATVTSQSIVSASSGTSSHAVAARTRRAVPLVLNDMGTAVQDHAQKPNASHAIVAPTPGKSKVPATNKLSAFRPSAIGWRDNGASLWEKLSNGLSWSRNSYGELNRSPPTT